MHSLKYLRSTTLGCKDIAVRKSEFVAKNKFFCLKSKLRGHKVVAIMSLSGQFIHA